MIETTLCVLTTGLESVVLHGVATSTPVPHWAVLLAIVPLLWLAIGGGVLALDRFLGLFVR